jgi:hypothetical protein
MLNFTVDVPGTGIIHPALDTLPPEGFFRGLTVDCLTGGLEWQIDLPDHPALSRLLFATALRLLIESRARNQETEREEREESPHSGISGNH